jgi:hypothetical protein
VNRANRRFVLSKRAVLAELLQGAHYDAGGPGFLVFDLWVVRALSFKKTPDNYSLAGSAHPVLRSIGSADSVHFANVAVLRIDCGNMWSAETGHRTISPDAGSLGRGAVKHRREMRASARPVDATVGLPRPSAGDGAFQ